MFCESCGEWIEDDALFCERCGTRVAAEAEPVDGRGNAAAGDATPQSPVVGMVSAFEAAGLESHVGRQPKAAPSVGEARDSRRRGLVAAAIALSVAGVALAVGAGVLIASMSRDGQGEPPRTETVTDGKSSSASAGAACPDIDDAADRLLLNRFMSNFSESGMYAGNGASHFDRDDPDLGRMADFLLSNNIQNRGTRNPVPGGSGVYVPWSSVEYMTSLFFDRSYDWSDYLASGDHGNDADGLRFPTDSGRPMYGPTVVESVEDLGDARIRIRYTAYADDVSDAGAYLNQKNALSYSRSSNRDAVYRKSENELDGYFEYSGSQLHGTAILEARRDGDAWGFALVSYDLD